MTNKLHSRACVRACSIHTYTPVHIAHPLAFSLLSQARFRKIAKHIHELKQVMRDDAATAFFSLTQAAQYVAGDFRGKVRA